MNGMIKKSYRNFNDWFGEQEGFGTRAERFEGDLGWLIAAFEAGSSCDGVGTKAIYRRPSGFSEPSHYESRVTIVGYVWGNPNAPDIEECAMAVVVTEDGSFKSIPLANLSIAPG